MACSCGCCQRQIGSLCPFSMVRVRRFVRMPLVPIGDLRGLIYRAQRAPGEAMKNYVHFFKGRPPVLASNPTGTRLYIVGGQYRVTNNGIQEEHSRFGVIGDSGFLTFS